MDSGTRIQTRYGLWCGGYLKIRSPLTNGRAVVRVLGFAARGRCGPSPSALQGRIYLGQNVSEQDVAPVTPIRRPADGERQSLYSAHAMCTDRDLVAGVARAQLPYASPSQNGWPIHHILRSITGDGLEYNLKTCIPDRLANP